MSAWKVEQIRVSGPHGIERKTAHTYGGLGLFNNGQVFGVVWRIIHLNSGHQIAEIRGAMKRLDQMKDLAAEIADAGDWSFDGLQGHKNQFPDAAAKVDEIVRKHLTVVRVPAGTSPDPVAAMAIARLREDETMPPRKDIEP